MATAKKNAASQKAVPSTAAPQLPHIGPAMDTNVPYPGVAPGQITDPANTSPLTDKDMSFPTSISRRLPYGSEDV